MTVSIRLLSSLLLVLFLLFGTGTAAFAHGFVVNFLPTNLSSWNTYGSPSVSSSQVTLQGTDREWVYIDIDAEHINEAYIVLAAYVDKVDTRSGLSISDKARSGNPYLYAYYLDQNGKILKYLTGAEMMSTTRPESDHVVYGIFPTISGTKSIRVFLKQSSVQNITNSGVDVSFVRPILLEANNKKEAHTLVRDFAKQLFFFR